MLKQFQLITDNSVAFTINKIIQSCVGKVDGFKSSDVVGTPICRGSSYGMVLNPTLDVLSAISYDGWDFRGENRILIDMKNLKHCLYVIREFQGSCHMAVIIYPPRISALVDDNNGQIVKKIASVLFNNKVKALMHNINLYTFRDFILAALLHHNKSLKGDSGKANTITVALLQAADVFCISLDTFKCWVRKVNEKH